MKHKISDKTLFSEKNKTFLVKTELKSFMHEGNKSKSHFGKNNKKQFIHFYSILFFNLTKCC